MANIYLLIDKKTNEVIQAYKYSQVAILAKDRVTPFEAISKMAASNKGSKYRVEVHRVVE